MRFTPVPARKDIAPGCLRGPADCQAWTAVMARASPEVGLNLQADRMPGAGRGFGFALAAVPLISLVTPPVQGVAIAILLQCMIGLGDLVSVRRLVDRSTLAMMSLGAMVGTPAGLVTLRLLSADAMRVVIALVVAADPPAVAYMLGTATPAIQARATLMAFFFVTSLIALPGLIVAATALLAAGRGIWGLLNA